MTDAELFGAFNVAPIAGGRSTIPRLRLPGDTLDALRAKAGA